MVCLRILIFLSSMCPYPVPRPLIKPVSTFSVAVLLFSPYPVELKVSTITARFQLVNPFSNRPLFLRVCYTSLLKTLSEKEKLAVTSNFSYSHSVLYTFGELSTIFIKLKIVFCKLFQFGRVQNLLFGKV